jgi:GxxExxY protein
MADGFVNTDNDALTEKIIGAAYSVANTLGYGFLEKVYENALALELKELGLNVEQQKSISVFYKNVNVGDYIADLMVEDTVLIELKSVKNLSDIHKAQLLNYLTATKKSVGLLINFGSPRVEIKRVLSNKNNP